MVIWITGLSGAGKSTLCGALVDMLKPRCPGLVVLDGDVVRTVFDDGLGYSEANRAVQIRRIQRLAAWLDGQGLVVLVGALYAHPDLLSWNRANFCDYLEVYLRADMSFLRGIDPKGLYSKAARGEISEVVGHDIPWHEPVASDLVLDAAERCAAAEWARRVAALHPKFAAA